MKAERNHLAARVFPVVTQACEAQKVRFHARDLRWGVTEAECASGEVIARCLDEVGRCRPFLICILGDNYGWCAAEDPGIALSMRVAARKYPWVAALADRSVTELEITHAFLRAPPSERRACLFYFKRPPAGGAPAAGPRTEPDRRLAALKQRLADCGAAPTFFSTPAELGDAVLADTTKLVGEIFDGGGVAGGRYGGGGADFGSVGGGGGGVGGAGGGGCGAGGQDDAGAIVGGNRGAGTGAMAGIGAMTQGGAAMEGWRAPGMGGAHGPHGHGRGMMIHPSQAGTHEALELGSRLFGEEHSAHSWRLLVHYVPVHKQGKQHITEFLAGGGKRGGAGNALGVTGAPGSGKSTLMARMFSNCGGSDMLATHGLLVLMHHVGATTNGSNYANAVLHFMRWCQVVLCLKKAIPLSSDNDRQTPPGPHQPHFEWLPPDSPHSASVLQVRTPSLHARDD